MPVPAVPSPASVLHIHDLNRPLASRRVLVFLWAVAAYLLLSVAFFSGVENMSALDAVYYAVITMATVGYGDKKPETLEGRIFAIFFVLLGFSVLAYGFSLAASFALHKAETMKAKHETRVNSLKNKVAEIRVPTVTVANSLSTCSTHLPLDSSSSSVVVDETGMNGIELNQQRSECSSDFFAEDFAMLRYVEGGSGLSNFGTVSQLSEAYRNSFQWETYKMKRRCIRNLVFITCFMTAASFVIMVQEGWTFSDSVYWAVVTITTVGYGDYTPETPVGKVITIIYVLVGCVSMASIWSELIKYPLMVKFKENELAIISQFDENVSPESLKSIGQSKLFANITNLKTTSPAELSKIEFVLGMLELMGKVRRSDVVLASTMFDRLDGNGDGLIDCEEMARAMERFQQDQGSLTTSNDDFAY